MCRSRLTNPFEPRQVFCLQRLGVGAAVVLDRAHRRDDHCNVRPQTRLTALDVDKLFRAEVSTEACFRHHIVSQL